MQLPLKWQRQPIAGAPSEFYSKASTTKSAYLAQEAVTIIELNQISPFHQQKDFRPSANRNVAMFKNDDLWLFRIIIFLFRSRYSFKLLIAELL